MSPVEISVVCPVGRHALALASVHREFRDVLERLGRTAEFLYVVDGTYTGSDEELLRIRAVGPRVRLFRMARGFGEATALQYGFERATGRYVLTIADRPQIDADVLADVLACLDEGREVVVTRREPRSDPWFNRLQSRAFHRLVRLLVGQTFNDLSCGVRGFTLEAARRLDLYGDQHRFIPVIAMRSGYSVVEIPGAQHRENLRLRVRAPGLYMRRLLDVLNIYFLTRFTRKPLRFFGLIGGSIGLVGFAISAYLAVQRLFGTSALADRPLLLLGVLLIVLGVQVLSIGLLGEIIIFLSSKREMPRAAEYLEPGEVRQPPPGAESVPRREIG
jgi:glycosyltransferase involved in cell wall biosynthesis